MTTTELLIVCSKIKDRIKVNDEASHLLFLFYCGEHLNVTISARFLIRIKDQIRVKKCGSL